MERLLTSVSELEGAKVRAWARREDRSVSAWVRLLIAAELERRDGVVPALDAAAKVEARVDHEFVPQKRNQLKCESCGKGVGDHR